MSNQLLIVSKDVNYGASKSSTAANAATYPHDLRDGALGWFDASDNTLITASTDPTATPDIFLARGVADGANILTPIINRHDVVGWNGREYSAGQDGIQIVGYDGVNSSLDITVFNNTSYSLLVRNISDENYNENSQEGGTLTGSSADSFNIAWETAKDYNGKKSSANMPYGRLSPDPFARAEVLSDATSADVETGGAADITGTVTQGSKKVQLTDTPANLSAGDTVRIGSTNDTTDPVYYVEAFDSGSNVLTLGMPYQGASASGVDLGYISGKPTSASNGIRFTTVEPGISIHVALQGGFEGTEVINQQKPEIPVNSHKKIKELAEFLQGKWGHYNKRDVPMDFPTFVEDGTNYDTYHLKLKSEDVKELSRISNPASPLEIIIAVPDSPGTFTNSNFEVINNWFNASPLNYANVTL